MLETDSEVSTASTAGPTGAGGSNCCVQATGGDGDSAISSVSDGCAAQDRVRQDFTASTGLNPSKKLGQVLEF